MRFIDPHIHFYSRVTDDYEAMALAGVRAVVEPSFWLGQPRSCAGTFRDYFLSLLEFEPRRAAEYGIAHRCAIALNPKEANDERLAGEVLDLVAELSRRDGVVAIGEVGYDAITPAEERALVRQVALALELDLPLIVHTPHRDKLRGTQRTFAVLQDMAVPPERVVIDHSTEETTGAILERGYWAGHTLYPETKLSPQRFVNLFLDHGVERMLVNSSADWGKSDPLSVPRVALLLERRGAPRERIQRLVWDNPLRFFGAERLRIPDGGAAPAAPSAAAASPPSAKKVAQTL